MIEQSLHACRILVVEDEYLLAEELAQELMDAGAVVIGPAPTIKRAMGLLDQAAVHGAVLDVNLGGEPVFTLADTLIKRGVPLVFTTGYDPATLPMRFVAIPICGKPIDTARLTSVIRDAIHA